MITVGWWVCLPIVAAVSNALKPSMGASGLNVATAIEYANYVWGPILDVFIVLLALLNSQRRDVESEVYGY
jgi:hypothetical protein